MKPTEEQQAAINQEGDFKLIAVAGSGKTSTLIEYAAARPHTARILYLAFNRTVRMEAQHRFLKRGLNNVTVHTAHSLAYRYVIVKGKYKLIQSNGYTLTDIVDALGLAKRGRMQANVMASHIQRFTSYFCNSYTNSIDDLVYEDCLDPNDKKSRRYAQKNIDTIYAYTKEFYQKMDDRSIPCSHDWYLKKFQFIAPQLPFDYILFDEGQDASETMLEVFFAQKAVKVIVGDENQQIYGFRYAVNSLRKMQAPTLKLTQSFRFGQRIADIAQYALTWKGYLETVEPVHIEGLGRYEAPENGLHCTIGRTNVALLGDAIESLCIKEEIGSVYFEGNFETYTYMDNGGSLFDVHHLYNDDLYKIRNPLLKSMRGVDELKLYIDQTGDHSMKLSLEIVEKYEDLLPDYIQQIKDAHVEEKERSVADKIFSTVHRCKGMEYDSISICDDFITEEKLLDAVAAINLKPELAASVPALQEEVNMLYVALTRTKDTLYMPEAFYDGYTTFKRNEEAFKEAFIFKESKC